MGNLAYSCKETCGAYRNSFCSSVLWKIAPYLSLIYFFLVSEKQMCEKINTLRKDQANILKKLSENEQKVLCFVSCHILFKIYCLYSFGVLVFSGSMKIVVVCNIVSLIISCSIQHRLEAIFCPIWCLSVITYVSWRSFTACPVRKGVRNSL